MISVPYPHMALNSHNAPGAEYKMWNTWKVPKSTSVSQIVDGIATIARSVPVRKNLATVIINGHGRPGRIGIGQGITLNDVSQFNVLKTEGLVDYIWIIACKVASIREAGSEKYDGNYFCYRLAQESGAFIKASRDTQWARLDLPLIDEVPYGFIDDWEGIVCTWNPQGELIRVGDC